MSALPSSRKTHSERHKQIFRQLLKEAPNKTCADCKTATHPRWASWNLGCFVCIRCLGIHRSMGTHILRVKSVDLDAWTDEQVESMVKWGNDKCNTFWEAKLPANYVPDASKIENFIRTKYDMKKWAASSHVPDPMKLKAPPKAAPAPSAPVPSASKAPASAPSALDPSSKKGLLLDDDFGSFTSSPLATPTPAQQSPIPQHAKVAPPPPAKNERTDLKKSILSLYSSPSSSSSSVQNSHVHLQSHVPHVQHVQPHVQHVQSNGGYSQSTGKPVKPQNPVGSLSDSLLGLNFAEKAPAKPAAPAAKSSLWSNEWNDSSESVSKWAPSYNGTSASITPDAFGTFSGTFAAPYSKPVATKDDDDLFKNVWS